MIVELLAQPRCVDSASPSDVPLAFPRETLENQCHSRDNGAVIADHDWVDVRQAARHPIGRIAQLLEGFVSW